MSAATADQPPPTPSSHPASWDLVLADINALEARGATPGAMQWASDQASVALVDIRDDIAARDLIGLERYGVRLAHGNGRDHLVDAYQEALDFVVYLRTEIYKMRLGADHNPPSSEEFTLHLIFRRMLDDLVALRIILSRREACQAPSEPK